MTRKIKLTRAVIIALCQQWKRNYGAIHCLTEASAAAVANIAAATNDRDVEDRDIEIFYNMLDAVHIVIN